MIKPENTGVDLVNKVIKEVKTNVEIPMPDTETVKKPLSVTASVFLTATEKAEGKSIAKCKVAFTFVYLAEEGYKKSEVTADALAELPIDDALVTVTASEARIVASADGYVARCILIFKGESSIRSSFAAVTGGEGLLVKEFTQNVDVNTGISRDTLRIEDEFEVGYAVSEVLSHVETVELGEVKSGISSVVFDGEVNLSLCLLPFSENSDILREKRNIPFRFELENVGTLPNMRAEGLAEIKKVAVKVVADEGKSKSVVTVEMTLEFAGEGIDSVPVKLTSDAYSNYCEIVARKEQKDFVNFIGQFNFSEKFDGSANCEMPSGGRMITAVGERVEVYSHSVKNGIMRISGVVRADVVFKNADNGTSVAVAEMPFDMETEVAGEPTFTKISLSDFSARAKNGGIDFAFTLKASYKVYERITAECITSVEEGVEKKVNDSALSVYIPTAGDGLWEVAKALGATNEEIEKYNGELNYPLTGEERIIIYRRKT